MDHAAQHLVTTLKARRLTVAFAESMTCGQAAYLLSGCSGASEVLKGSVVCYSPDMKMQLFNISQSTINKHSCESMNVTRLLAGRLTKLIKAEIYGAITGLASPGGSETKGKPVGTVFFCVYYQGKPLVTQKLFRGTPSQIKKKACLSLYELILSAINSRKRA